MILIKCLCRRTECPSRAFWRSRGRRMPSFSPFLSSSLSPGCHLGNTYLWTRWTWYVRPMTSTMDLYIMMRHYRVCLSEKYRKTNVFLFIISLIIICIYGVHSGILANRYSGILAFRDILAIRYTCTWKLELTLENKEKNVFFALFYRM